MRYKPGQKEETRKKMLVAASYSFREHGFDGVGVDGLAKAAGVTSGAFYTHFGSKKAAFDESVMLGLDEVIDGVPVFQQENGKTWVQAFVDYYLGKNHREDLAGGCAMTSLTPEVIRREGAAHEAYEKKMKEIIKLMAMGLAGGSEKNRQARAWSMLSALIGGLSISRAISDIDLAEEIAHTVKASALQAAGETCEI